MVIDILPYNVWRSLLLLDVVYISGRCCLLVLVSNVALTGDHS